MKKRSIKPVSVRHVPQRTCVACGEVRPKRELIRLVRTSGGSVEVDPDGRRAGRGAYLCPAPECWEIGLKKGRLEYALRTTLTQENRESLLDTGRNWGEEQFSGKGE